MLQSQSIETAAAPQLSPGHSALADYLAAIDEETLLDRLALLRKTGYQAGRKGYPLRAMWRAYASRYFLNLSSTCALVRQLEDDSALRQLCGFVGPLPSRSTHVRFAQRISTHVGFIEKAQQTIADEFADRLEDFGNAVAVDGSLFRTHSNHYRKPVSDPDAAWTARTKNGPDGKQEERFFGYNLHALCDANYGVLIAAEVKPANVHDSKMLPPLLNKATEAHAWFRPAAVICDKGYDGEPCVDAIVETGAQPIIPMKRPVKGRLLDGIYTSSGAPTCLGMKTMAYIKTDPVRGHLYRCDPHGCRLRSRRGVLYCNDQTWEAFSDNQRAFPHIARDSAEWKVLYSKRQSIERCFKSLKESRCLSRHHIRGLKMLKAHAMMSVLAHSATALANLRAGQADRMLWQVRKVA